MCLRACAEARYGGQSAGDTLNSVAKKKNNNKQILGKREEIRRDNGGDGEKKNVSVITIKRDRLFVTVEQRWK